MFTVLHILRLFWTSHKVHQCSMWAEWWICEC